MSTVTWLRERVFGNGTTIKISDNSGILRIDVGGMGRRAVAIYRDELKTLLANAEQLEAYLDENEDVAFSKGQSQEAGKIKRAQMKAQAQAVKSFEAMGFSQEDAVNMFKAALDAKKSA